MSGHKKRVSKYTPGDFNLRVRRSTTGKGLYAGEAIPKGACIIEYTGKPITEELAKSKNGKYFFTVGRNMTIDGNVPSNTARFINHSCRPNCEADGPRGQVFIVALRRIKAGEELFYDYGEEYFNDILKPMGCKCVKCSKTR